MPTTPITGIISILGLSVVKSHLSSLILLFNPPTTINQGFHEFAEFTAEDVGTVDSGLNSVVLANNNEMVLLPVNEPTFGTRRKSQIQTYLEQNKVNMQVLLFCIPYCGCGGCNEESRLLAAC